MHYIRAIALTDDEEEYTVKATNDLNEIKQSSLVRFTKAHTLKIRGQLWTSQDGINYTRVKQPETEQSLLQR